MNRVRRELERSGALETVRSDVARGKALEFLVEHATVVDESGNTIDVSLDNIKNEDANPPEASPTEVEVEEDEEPQS